MPAVLRDASASLLANPAWAADEASTRTVHGLLAQGLPRPQYAAGLSDALTALPSLSWLRLAEVAEAPDATNPATRTATAFSALAALGSPAVVMLGGDGSGRVGLAVGLPRERRLAQIWRSAQAPDAIWEDGEAPGWAVLTDPGHVESAWACRPVPIEPRERPAAAQPPGLGVLLSAAGGLSTWCAAVVLSPLPDIALLSLRARLGDLEALAARQVTRSESLTEAVSASVSDPRARLVADALHAWVSLADDGVRTGAWRASVHLCAGLHDDLLPLGSAFGWLLGPDVTSSQHRRHQVWDGFDAAAGAPAQFGLLSSRDLGDLLAPPRESVGTIQVRRPLGGGRQTVTIARPLDLGVWLGTDIPAVLDVDDLTGHGFVTGITGSGKSTTTRTLLTQLWNRYRIPFLVIDPAKADYADMAGHLDGGLTLVSGADLRMNALAAWPGRPADAHIRAVSTALRGSFGMPMPVPYVAAILLEELASAARQGVEVTLHDALARLDSLIDELAYRGEVRDNIRASLGLRLRLLLQPSRAERVAGSGPPLWLADGPTVVHLGELTDEDERAFVASLLVLYVADAARARGDGGGVRHVTVIEEAHRLMPEPRDVSPEVGDPGAVSAVMMTHLLAEVRAYGETVVVVDQSPAAVARAVLRSTNVKIVHRVVDSIDQQALGGAMGLADEESPMLGSLGVGRCLVSSGRLLRPQTAAVPPPPEQSEARRTYAPPPTGRTSGCHTPDAAEYHHASERHGLEMELAVALWAADGARGDLIGRAQVLRLRDPAVRPACLMSVGLRRHVATLVRLGHLAPDSAGDHARALWACATAGEPAPPAPSSGRTGPYPACVACPLPCLARPAAASGGLGALRRTSAEMPRLASSTDVTRIAEGLARVCETEVADGISEATAKLVGFCAAVHLAAAHDVSRSLLAAVRPEVAGPGEGFR